MTILYFFLFLILAMELTWISYLSMMPLKRNYKQGTLNTINKIFGYPWLAIFILIDFLFNIIVGTIIFLDIPRDFLFTKRLVRYLTYNHTNWRHKMARYFCTQFLDPFDPDGFHCQHEDEHLGT